MSLAVYTTQSKELLKLMPKPFASGGEGNLYKVEMPLHWQNHVVKIYHPAKRTIQKQQKISYLLQHTPANTKDASIIWVKDEVKDERGDFLGLVMPMAKGEKLEILCSSRLPRKLQNTWYRFHPKAPQSLQLRLKVCYNIMVAIQQIHAINRYVLVDFKPDNVIIQPNGIVALVDLDSVEVVENGKKLFDAPVATPEYTPPEYYRDNNTDPTQQQAWDRFSMAAVCYKLLLGVHPFAATHKGKFANCTNLAQKIEHGLYVHAPQWKKDLLGVPPLHQKYHQLHPSIQDLFKRCFIEGHTAPVARPSALEWCSALLQYLDVNSHRALPSTAIETVNYQYFFRLQQLPQTPQEVINKLSPQEVQISLEHPLEDYTKLKMQRQIAVLVIIVIAMIAVVVGVLISWIISAALVVVLLALLVNSYEHRMNQVATWTNIREMEEEQRFWEKQQQVYLGVEEYVRAFYQNLKTDYNQLIRKEQPTTKANVIYEIELEQKRLKEQLQLEDKQAKQLIDSERFEYEQLSEKYTRQLRTHPEFEAAVSPDAELAAIDFAQQEALARVHNDLGKQLQKKQQEYESQIEQKERLLNKVEREANKKFAKEKQYLKLAKQKAILKQELLSQKKQQVSFALVNEYNLETEIKHFREEIRDLLQDRAKITSVLEIASIGKRTLLLQSGKKVPLTPLRYFHINDLVDWWQRAKRGDAQLSDDEIETIDLEFEEKLALANKRIRKQLNASQQTIEKELAELNQALQKIRQALTEKNRDRIKQVNNSYQKKRVILEQITQAKRAEEEKIHQQYNQKYQILLDNAAQKVAVLNTFIKTLFFKNKRLSDQKIKQYQGNLERYQKGLQRLEEEHQRLQHKQKDQLENEFIRKYRLDLTLGRHLLQMCYLQPIETRWKSNQK